MCGSLLLPDGFCTGCADDAAYQRELVRANAERRPPKLRARGETLALPFRERGSLLERLREKVARGWFTLAELREELGAGEATISARLREVKAKRRARSSRVYEYSLAEGPR